MKINNTIYLDHQATTPVDSDVLAEMLPFFRNSFGNSHSSDHSIGWHAALAVEKAANRVAQFIGADADEIIFTSGATEANNLALLGLGIKLQGNKRQRILTTNIEHKSVLETCYALQERCGFKIDLIPVDSSGQVNCEELNQTLNDDVLIVSIMAVNNEIGTIQNILALSKIIKSSGAIFHCDAAQAPCAIDLQLLSRHVDLLSLSAHKMYGPQGVGALFVRRDLQSKIEPLIYGGGQQHTLRSGTVAVPLCVGMGAAANRLHSENQAAIRSKMRQRRDLFVKKILDLPYPIFSNGPISENRHPGNANIRFEGLNAQDLLGTLQPRLSASTGSACNSAVTEGSYVLRAIGLSEPEAASSIRFSLGEETTVECLDKAFSYISQSLDEHFH